MNRIRGKHILLVTHDFPPMSGGVAIFLRNVCDQLVKRGWAIDVLAPYVNDEIDEFAYPVHRYKPLGGRFSAWNLIRETIVAYWRLRTDVVFVGHLMDTPLLGIMLLKRLFGIPYVILVHGTDLRLSFGASTLRRQIGQWALCNASWVLTNSYFTKEKVQQVLGIAKRNVAVLYPGIDLATFRPDVDASSVTDRYDLAGKKVILTVARLVKIKQHDIVLRAVAEILDQIPNLIYLIVGLGAEEEILRHLCAELDIQSYVTFTGAIEHVDLARFYCACDVFVMPSSSEGFGIAFLEASACGKPVIGTRIGGIPEVIVDGVTGILIEPNSVDKMTQALLALLLDEDKARQLGRNGREWVAKNFSWECVGEWLEAILQCPCTLL